MTGSNVAGDTRQASEVTPLEDYIMTAVIDQRSTRLSHPDFQGCTSQYNSRLVYWFLRVALSLGFRHDRLEERDELLTKSCFEITSNSYYSSTIIIYHSYIHPFIHASSLIHPLFVHSSSHNHPFFVPYSSISSLFTGYFPLIPSS